jgi:nucleoside-diphosphate-sugar epimerase
MKICVAGGAGYIGSLLIPKLIEYGYDVTVIDLFWFGNNLPERVKIVKKDLHDCTVNDFKDFEQLIFLGGLSNDPMAEFNPSMNFISNGALPSYLAYIAKLAGVSRFIYGSSCSVYGYTVDKLYDENSPVTCSYPYGISKLQGERGVLHMQDENFSVISLRQGTVSGYSPRMRFDLIINTMYQHAFSNSKVTVNNPSIWRPILDIRDCVSAYIRSIQANDIINGVFNISSGNYTVGQVGEVVKDEVERLTGKKISIEINNLDDNRNYKVCIDNAMNILGFNPKYDIRDTIKNIHEHSEEYGDLEQNKYYNIKQFKNLKFDQ